MLKIMFCAQLIVEIKTNRAFVPSYLLDSEDIKQALSSFFVDAFFTNFHPLN